MTLAPSSLSLWTRGWHLEARVPQTCRQAQQHMCMCQLWLSQAHSMPWSRWTVPTLLALRTALSPLAPWVWLPSLSSILDSSSCQRLSSSDRTVVCNYHWGFCLLETNLLQTSKQSDRTIYVNQRELRGPEASPSPGHGRCWCR